MERIYSQDRNLWHLSNEGGPLEDPWNEPPKDMFEWTTDPTDAPDEAEYVEIYFRRGVPERVNGVARWACGAGARSQHDWGQTWRRAASILWRIALWA